MKKLCRFLIQITLLLLFLSASFSVSAGNSDAADNLKKLGLFRGTEKGLELERQPTKLEGIILLIRLIGKEDEALRCTDTHPFTDVPAWANAYVAYAYRNKLCNGSSNTVFGSYETLTLKQYATFILRALGYSEKDGDFIWSKSDEKAAEIGLLDGISNTNSITRGTVAAISWNALKQEYRGKIGTIAENLAKDGVISKKDAVGMNLYNAVNKRRVVHVVHIYGTDAQTDSKQSVLLPQGQAFTVGCCETENYKLTEAKFNSVSLGNSRTVNGIAMDTDVEVVFLYTAIDQTKANGSVPVSEQGSNAASGSGKSADDPKKQQVNCIGTFYWQNDNNWKMPKGEGCYITALAMAINNLGVCATPDTVFSANGDSVFADYNKISTSLNIKIQISLAPSKEDIITAVKQHPNGVVVTYKAENFSHAILAVAIDSSGAIRYNDPAMSNGQDVSLSESWVGKCGYDDQAIKSMMIVTK